ncbi:MAG: c-type cytochrome [Xanthomonadales bacterium]|nr:c-type cytochrome [Xanthomonadales bacterium]
MRLGQTLFWDEQVSLTGTVACGTCHAPRGGGSDPRDLAQTEAARNPGGDGVFGTNDDALGALGVPRHDADGLYDASTHFGLLPQPGGRQAPSMVNAGYFNLLFWDGRAASRFDNPDGGATLIASGGALENQAIGPIVNDVEMAHVGESLGGVMARLTTTAPLRLAEGIPADLSSWIAGRSYPELFTQAFGTPDITAARFAMALASYQRSLVADQTPLDNELRGTPSLTPQERAGRQVFTNSGCAGCHGGALLSDDNFHYIGVRPQNADAGRFGVTGANPDRGAMHTPSLRHVELSAPYMANGRFATLEEVVDFYDRGGDFTAPNLAPGIRPLNLTAQQKTDLVAFLKRPLTDPRLVSETGPFAHPSLFAESNRAPRSADVGVPDKSTGLTPELIALEPPLAGTSEYFTIGLQFARAGATVYLVVDLADPIGVSDPSADSLWDFPSLVTDAQGRASAHLLLPNVPELQDTPLFLRAFVEDEVPGVFAVSQRIEFSLLEVTARIFRGGFED